jgi:hypothetical protein
MIIMKKNTNKLTVAKKGKEEEWSGPRESAKK